MQISLIPHQHYPFLVDIHDQDNVPAAPVAKPPLKVTDFAILFFKSFYSALKETTTYSRTIFWGALIQDKYITINPALLFFKLILGASYLGLSIIFGTHRIMEKALSPPKDTNLLLNFLGPHINPNHIKSGETTLNVDQVPPDVTIDLLLTYFDEGDFTANDLLDDGTRLTKESARECLVKFIRQVKNRTPFLGTPPAYEAARLEAFYSHIEKAVRLCINQTKNDRTERIALALDFAKAGNHCGARYMGEAISAHTRLCSNDPTAVSTLEEKLIRILSLERLDIAQKRALAELGSSTHSLPKYLSDFGDILGLPGTENVIEHLSFSKLSEATHLPKFFEKYNENAIIKAVQDALKSKDQATFRQAFIEWIDGQIGTWDNPDDHEPKIRDIIDKCRPVIEEIPTFDESTSTSELSTYLEAQFSVRIDATEIQSRGLLSKGNLHTTLTTFIKERVNGGANLTGPQRAALLGQITACSNIFNKKPINKLAQIIYLESELLLTPEELVANGLTNLDNLDLKIREFYETNIREKRRKEVFYKALGIDDLEKIGPSFDDDDNTVAGNGVPDNVIRWALIQHNILSYKDAIDGVLLEQIPETSSLSREIKQIARPLANRELSWIKFSSREAAFKAIFERSLRANPERILSLKDVPRPPFTDLKRICLIKIPKAFEIISNSTLAKILTCAYIFFKTLGPLNTLYSALELTIPRIPLLNTAFKIAESILKFKALVGLSLLIGSRSPLFAGLRNRIGRSRYDAFASALIFSRQETFSTFVCTIGLAIYSMVNKIFNNINAMLRRTHRKFAATLIRDSKPLIYQEWRNSLPPALLG